MSERRPNKKVKFAVSSSSSDEKLHLRTHVGLSQKASELLSTLGIKEGETYVEIPEGKSIVVPTDGDVSKEKEKKRKENPNSRYGPEWTKRYFDKMKDLKSNLTYAWLEMLSAACGINISAAVDDAYMDTFRRLSEIQNKIIKRDIDTTRVTYKEKIEQRDHTRDQIKEIEDYKMHVGTMVSPKASKTFLQLIEDSLMHAYHRYLQTTAIAYSQDAAEFENKKLKDKEVEKIAKVLFRGITGVENHTIGESSRRGLVIYIIRYLAGMYYLYLQCPTFARVTGRREDSLIGLLDVNRTVADPRHLKYIAIRPGTDKGENFDSEMVHNGEKVSHSDHLRVIYSILDSLIRIKNAETRASGGRVIDINIAHRVVESIIDIGYQYDKIFDAIRTALAPQMTDLYRRIENMRLECQDRLLFTSDTTRRTNDALFIYTHEDPHVDGAEEAMMSTVATIIFTSCFRYNKTYTGSLMALYLCIYSQTRTSPRVDSLPSHAVVEIGSNELTLIRSMLLGLNHGTRDSPNRISIPGELTASRALLEKYIMPVAAVSSVASTSAPTQPPTDAEEEEHISPELYVGRLPGAIQGFIKKFVAHYFKRKSQASNPPTNNKKRKSPDSPARRSRSKRRNSSVTIEGPEAGEEPAHIFEATSEPPTPPLRPRIQPLDGDSSGSDDDDDFVDDEEEVFDSDEEHSTGTRSLSDFEERLEKFRRAETRKSDAFSNLLTASESLGELSYTTLSAMFETASYPGALEIWKDSRTDLNPNEFVNRLIGESFQPENRFAESYPLVYFSVLYNFYVKETSDFIKILNKRLRDLDENLQSIEDQLVRFARGHIDGGESASVDLMTSPDSALSVLQSGRFIINPKLSIITYRVHSGITLDPLFNFQGCPLDALTTPLPNTILFSVSSIFADICGMEYNRRNVANGTIAYANNNTVKTQEQELKSSGMSLSYYRWVPKDELDGLTLSRLSDVEHDFYEKFGGWFMKDPISSILTNAPIPKREVTVFVGPGVGYTLKGKKLVQKARRVGSKKYI